MFYHWIAWLKGECLLKISKRLGESVLGDSHQSGIGQRIDSVGWFANIAQIRRRVECTLGELDVANLKVNPAKCRIQSRRRRTSTQLLS